jgi:hypothetical protein
VLPLNESLSVGFKLIYNTFHVVVSINKRVFIPNFVLTSKQILMATAIKSIPTLTEKVAKTFIRKADVETKKRGSVNFSKQVSAANKILEKAKMK